ncbi:MAG: Dabb family protein [Saprospiraceae bacterium]|nr:Dabb family protein [Saprospiraceae bacterium]
MEKTKLRHVVLFKFKDSSSDKDVKMVEEAFKSLPEQISEIKSFEWGTNNSPEGLNQGLTHCFFLTFDSEDGRDAYLIHPDHKKFGKMLGPHLDKVTVVDYWVKE